jgi:hypothetical protein
VDDAFLMCVLDGMAHVPRQFQPLPRMQSVLVTVLRDRSPFDQFHHKVRPAGIGGSCVEDFGDVGMIHHCQRLAFGFKPRDDLSSIHARLDDLHGDATCDDVLLPTLSAVTRQRPGIVRRVLVSRIANTARGLTAFGSQARRSVWRCAVATTVRRDASAAGHDTPDRVVRGSNTARGLTACGSQGGATCDDVLLPTLSAVTRQRPGMTRRVLVSRGANTARGLTAFGSQGGAQPRRRV